MIPRQLLSLNALNLSRNTDFMHRMFTKKDKSFFVLLLTKRYNYYIIYKIYGTFVNIYA